MASLYVANPCWALDVKNNNDVSRRDFLLSASALSGTTVMRLSATTLVALANTACTAREEQSGFETLGPSEAADIGAIAARIIPTTDTVGASDAGVIYFFDKALGAEMSDRLGEIRTGLRRLNESVGHAKAFADLPTDEQDDRLRSIEDTAFFLLLREMTIYGFFAMSAYGGNKDRIAWDLIGFEGHNGGWRYPFGYYDAQVHVGTDDAE